MPSWPKGFIIPPIPRFFPFPRIIVSVWHFQYYDKEFTLWDRFEVNGLNEAGEEMTLQELFDYFQV